MRDSNGSPDTGRLLIHHGSEGCVRLTGADRQSWLQGIITANVAGLEQGAFWGLFLDRTGRIRHEVIGLVDPTTILLFPLSHGLKELHNYLDSMLVMEDAELEIASGISLWSIHGRAAELPLAHEEALAWGNLAWVTPNDVVVAVRVVDEPGWLAALRGVGVVPASRATWDNLRVAAGVPQWGADYNDQDTPHHAGLYGRAVAPNKGCYVGQEVVCKVEMRGHVAHRVAHLILDSADGVSVGMPVQLKVTGEVVGNVTSLGAEPNCNRMHILARVKSAHLQQRSEFLIGAAGAQLSEENLSA